MIIDHLSYRDLIVIFNQNQALLTLAGNAFLLTRSAS